MKYNNALDLLKDIFRIEDKETEIEKKINRKAEEDVFAEILKEMTDDSGKVPVDGGGRFIKKPKEEVPDLILDGETRYTKEEMFKTQEKWRDTGPKPKDLISLIFNILTYRMGVSLSLDTKLVMSSDGDHIFMVVRGDVKDLKRVAEEDGFNVQLAVGITDLPSLEPCDPNLVPLRACESEIKEVNELEKNLKEYFELIEGNIREDDT